MKKISAYTGVLCLTGLLSVSFILGGCQKKQEEPKPAAAPVQTAPAVDSAAIKAQAAKEAAEKAAKEVSLVGTWKGELESKATTLKITDQKENEFNGTIVVNYREQVNQKISGKINPETKEVTMKDMIKARTAGTYKGKLSEDGKKLSGTFTTTVDKITVKFNLTLK